MTRLTVKLSALLLLSAGYLMASSASTKPNLIKDASKTKAFCECPQSDGNVLIAECPLLRECNICCAGGS